MRSWITLIIMVHGATSDDLFEYDFLPFLSNGVTASHRTQNTDWTGQPVSASSSFLPFVS